MGRTPHPAAAARGEPSFPRTKDSAMNTTPARLALARAAAALALASSLIIAYFLPERIIADADGDGLIEIATARELHNMRHSLDGSRYRPEAGADGSAIGCPEVGCVGYELVADINFDSDGDGSTWRRRADGSVELDAGDHDSVHFDTEAGGWAPIGDCGADWRCFRTWKTDWSADNRPFVATFDGNGHTIAGLATAGEHARLGMFGFIGEGAEIRNLGLIGNLARYVGPSNANVGGLVGLQYRGSIISSHATGPADGGAGFDNVGGLVGQQSGGSITASHATGPADGGAGSDRVGGLVGSLGSGSITASWATGDADGGAGERDRVGGLVGQQSDGSITASHATGPADGGAGDDDHVGGLVGALFNRDAAITASYATGPADGGAGDDDHVGGLVGDQSEGSITASYATGPADGGAGANDIVGGFVSFVGPLRVSITASWGFGTATGGTVRRRNGGGAGSRDRPAGVTQASQLASANVPASWSQASRNTLGAWDFGTASQAPALRYADYDGASRHRFHCADDAESAPTGAFVIPGCVDAPALIPGQRMARPVGQAAPGLVPTSAMGTRQH